MLENFSLKFLYFPSLVSQWLKPNMAASATTTFKSKTSTETARGLWLHRWSYLTVMMQEISDHDCIRLMPLYHFRRSQTLSPVRQHITNNYTLTTSKEPKFVQVRRTTEQQAVSRPYKVRLKFSYHMRFL